jgi:hypothetical protein
LITAAACGASAGARSEGTTTSTRNNMPPSHAQAATICNPTETRYSERMNSPLHSSRERSTMDASLDRTIADRETEILDRWTARLANTRPNA